MFRSLDRLASPVLALPGGAKRLLVCVVDAALCVLSVWLSYYLRLGEFRALTGSELMAAGISVGLAIPTFFLSGFYRTVNRYGGWSALMVAARAVAVYGVIYAAIFTAVGIPGVPRTIGLIQPVLLLMLVSASRAAAAGWLGGEARRRRLSALPRVLVYGAGAAGRQLAVAMAGCHEMKVIGFLDDDPRLQGRLLDGLPIYEPGVLDRLIEKCEVTDVLLALPSVSRKRRNEIIEGMLHAKVSIRTLPSLVELAQGRINISDLRELDIDDLLGRDPVVPDRVLMAKNIAGKVVLVTGAGGSIGSELCRQILQQQPAKLLLVDHSEFALYAIHQELEGVLSEGGEGRLVPLLASVRDRLRMGSIFATWHPETVYHAAAYKHVPLVEHNPIEGVRNNVCGTQIVAEIAVMNRVSDFVLISTDKAVRPTNIMGATKRLAEMVLQALAAERHSTKFTMVRFGNVLGSSGSVVPKFRQQIREGRAVTLTHPEVTRYFMTIPEAAQLVIQAGAMASGGDVFVLDMGAPVKIIDLARRMIELSGLTVRDDTRPDGDIEIEVSGLRPGEKLYEELLIGDSPVPTPHPRIMKAHEQYLPWSRLHEYLDELVLALDENNVQRVRELFGLLVTGYRPTGEIVDWQHMEASISLVREAAAEVVDKASAIA